MRQIGGYQVLRELPRGRAGRRYVASNPRTNEGQEELVALTLLDDEWVRDPAYLTILNAEAEAAIGFRHEVATRVLEVNRLDDAVAIAVELVDGQPLSEVLERTTLRSTRLPWSFFVWMGVQLTRVLQLAHATPWAEGEQKGMYHGQLCPSDVYFGYDGRIRLNGVGLGRSRARLPFTSPRIPYRAPELFDRHKPDHLTDIYGVGILLNDAIRGRTTFAKSTDEAMRRAVVAGTVPPLHLDVPSVPPALATIIGSALAKMPAERPSSLRHIEQTLRGFLDRTDDEYAAGIADHMKLLFKTSAQASPPPAVVLPEPPPIDAPPDEPWGKSSGARMSTDDGFADELAVEELVEVIVGQRIKQNAPGFGSTRPRALGVQETTPTNHSIPRSASEPDVSAPWAAYASPPPPREKDGFDHPVFEAPKPSSNGSHNSLLEALDAGGAQDLDFLVDAIVAGGQAPAPRTNPGFDDEEDSGFEIERNETPFPVNHVSPWDGDSPVEPSKPRSASGLVIEDPVVLPPYPAQGSSSSPSIGSDAPRAFGMGPTLNPGDIISERYKILGVLGEGGVSVVYRAEHTLLRKHVALKVMRPEVSSMPSAKERFQLEARAVCQLDHANIVRVTDFGYAADGRMFLVMDLVEGDSLASMILRAERIELPTALSFAIQLLRGLRHAHDSGVIHRDLKPDNIIIAMREGQPLPKILDFGIAKLTDQDGQRSITQAGTVFGTPRYMSPEQAAGEAIDLRTDLYTIGVILYHMLTGRMPFDGSSTVQILSRVLTQPPPPMRLEEPNREVGRAVEALVLRALEKERDVRFSSANEFMTSIEALARKHRIFV